MLNVMRDNLRHLKWVLVVVALAMLGYLGSYFDPRVGKAGAASDWAARVDGDAITTQEFLTVARNQDNYYRQLLGAQYEQMKQSLKLGSQAIQSLVDREIVLAEARALGLVATKGAISQSILVNPNFKDPSGNFIGKDRYTDYVGQNYDGGVEGFENSVANDILAKQWLEVMTASAQISDAELEQVWRSRNVRAAADYVFVPSTSASVASVDAATVAAWYASHQNDYKRGEARRVRLLVVDRQSQVKNANVTDAEIKADYDANSASYSRQEQRRVRHILFKVPAGGSETDKNSVRELAAATLARVQKGEDFSALARTLSQDQASAPQGGELGWFGRGAMVKPFDDAAFATPPGQFAPVVETSFGFHVIQVQEARAAGTTPLDEVKDTIRRRLELQRAQDLAATEARRIAAEIKTPADLDAVASKAALKVEDHLVSADDQPADLGPSPEFISAVLSMQAGQVSAPLGVARGLAIVACTDVLPSAVRPLVEVADKVRRDVADDRGRQAAYVSARRLASGSSLADGAKTMKLEVKKSGDITAGADLPGVGRVPELDAVLFGANTTVGAKGAVIFAGGAIAYEVTVHSTFEAAKFDADKPALRAQLLQQRRDQLAKGLIESLRHKHNIEVNQPLIDGVNG